MIHKNFTLMLNSLPMSDVESTIAELIGVTGRGRCENLDAEGVDPLPTSPSKVGLPVPSFQKKFENCAYKILQLQLQTPHATKSDVL